MARYRQYGTDSSGRPLLMSPLMAQWVEGLVWRLGWRPTIVQGAYMAEIGGGAADSQGYHDRGGCLDFRVWDLTATQVAQLIAEGRGGGAGAWLRDKQHGGMDSHVHIVLGADGDLAPGAAQQWRDYLAGYDGLASRDPDYHPRPDPLVTTPPKGWLMPTADEMAKAVWDRLIMPVGGASGDEIRAARMLAQVHNRTSSDRLTALILKAEPGLDPTTVTRAVKAALKQIGETP